MFNPQQFSQPPKGIECTQAHSTFIVRIPGRHSIIFYTGFFFLFMGISLACIIAACKKPDYFAIVFFVVVFTLIAIPFWVIDSKRKIVTEIIIESQYQFTVLQKQRNIILQSIKFDNYKAISLLKSKLDLSPASNYLHSYRWIDITDGDNSLKLPTHTQEQFEFIQKLLLELIESGEYDAALHADPRENPEINHLRAKYETIEEDESCSTQHY